ncbi:hypothetical protein ACCD06_06730 [Azospirillum sp. CT11-132]|uniref:hypothetical protein n=1 Tax=Azospirillum sp. CT11-132 TaxID=3396317 RepID=UPI0039A4F788
MKLLLKDLNVRENERGILVFAQSLSELLFDYSPDSYRAPALDTLYRCAETMVVCKDVISGKVKNQAAVTSVADELARSLHSDDIAKDILGNNYGAYVKFIEQKSKDQSAAGLLRVSSSLYDEMAKDYSEICVRNLRKAVLENDVNKIYRISQTFCSHLINLGYEREFMYYMMRSSFFYSRRETLTDRFEMFMNAFDLKMHQFSIYCYVNEELYELIKLSNVEKRDDQGNIEIKEYFKRADLEQMPPDLRERYSVFFRPRNGMVLTVARCEYYDPKGARSIIEGELNVRRATILTVYPRKGFSWDIDMLVVKENENHGNILRNQPSVLVRRDSKRTDTKDATLSRRFNLLRAYVIDDINRVNISVLAQKNAFLSESVEGQLTAFWSAFEALLPEPSGVRITSYLRYMIPCNVHYYSYQRFRMFDRDLWLAHKEKYLEIIGAERSVDNTKELAAIICLDKNEAKRKLIRVMCEERNPLAVMRMEQLHLAHSGIRELRTFLKSHKERVKWQIERIYRTRNSIMHAGESLPFLSAVLNNLQDYYMNTLFSLECTLKSTRHLPEVNLDNLFERTVINFELFEEKFQWADGQAKKEELKKDKKIEEDRWEEFVPFPCFLQ